jgi:hypothetical protein
MCVLARDLNGQQQVIADTDWRLPQLKEAKIEELTAFAWVAFVAATPGTTAACSWLRGPFQFRQPVALER